MDTIKASAESKMKKSITALKNEFNSIRTGRASASIFDKIKVEYYGTPTPLNQLATISIPEARLIVIQPFDKNSLNDIEKSIFASDLGLTPGNDGKVIRINIPPLTEERRIELARQARHEGEEAKVSLRNSRHKIMDFIKNEVKDGYPEDIGKRKEKEVEDMVKAHVSNIDALIDAKEKDIMKV